MGRNVGGHANRNPGRTIQQQLWQPRGHHRWFLLGTIEVVDEINGFRFNVLQQRLTGQGLQPTFRVPHGGWRVVVDRTEVAVTVNQRVAHRKILGHPHQRVIDRRVAVGVIFPQHFPHHPGAFPEGAIGRQTQLMHGIQNPAVYRLQTVAGIRQRPPHDHAHGVFQVRSRHFLA